MSIGCRLIEFSINRIRWIKISHLEGSEFQMNRSMTRMTGPSYDRDFVKTNLLRMNPAHATRGRCLNSPGSCHRCHAGHFETPDEIGMILAWTGPRRETLDGISRWRSSWWRGRNFGGRFLSGAEKVRTSIGPMTAKTATTKNLCLTIVLILAVQAVKNQVNVS